jgi:protein-disulfide isomerase
VGASDTGSLEIGAMILGSRGLCLFIAMSLLASTPALSQSNQEVELLRKEVEALKEGQATIRKELEEIRGLLRGRQAARPAEPQYPLLSVDGAPFLGDKNAAVTLIEFSDYQCPFCARHVRDTLPQLERDYIRTGKLRYVLRDFPIESIHPQAFKAHEAARCAGEQESLWEMHARLFANQQTLGSSDLEDHAKALGLDTSKFRLCMESGRSAEGIRIDMAEGSKVGVNGTPSFFLGVTDPSDAKVKVLRTIRGAQPFGTFKEAVESLLLSLQKK